MQILVMGKIFPGFFRCALLVHCLGCHVRRSEITEHEEPDISLKFACLRLCRRKVGDNGLAF